MRLHITPEVFTALKFQVHEQLRKRLASDGFLEMSKSRSLWNKYHPKQPETLCLVYYLIQNNTNNPQTDRRFSGEKFDPQYLPKKKKPSTNSEGKKYISLGKDPHDWIYFKFCGYDTLDEFLDGMVEKDILDRTQQKEQEALQGKNIFEFAGVSNKRNFINKKFYLYFFYAHPLTSDPYLGRAVLSIDKYENVSLKNVPDDMSLDYIGKFDLINNQVLFFDLHSPGRAEARLHMKILCRNEPKEISLGGYISFEMGTIVMGSVVLHYERDRQGLEAALLAYHKNKEEFEKTPDEIKQYLAIKHLNHQKTPKLMTSTSHLEILFEKHKHKKKTLFFEESVPRVFISSPETTILKNERKENFEKMKDLEEKLKDYFDGNIEFEYHRGFNKYSGIDKIKRILRKTTLFILISKGTENSSFSLTEAGIALVTCKHILVFYTRGSVPQKLIDIQETHAIEMEKEKFDWNKVREDIKAYIIGNNILPEQKPQRED